MKFHAFLLQQMALVQTMRTPSTEENCGIDFQTPQRLSGAHFQGLVSGLIAEQKHHIYCRGITVERSEHLNKLGSLNIKTDLSTNHFSQVIQSELQNILIAASYEKRQMNLCTSAQHPVSALFFCRPEWFLSGEIS